jgi:hypothetical protein
VADGSGVARKAGTCRWSQGTLLLVFLSAQGRQGRLIKAPIHLQDHALEDLRPGEGRCDGMRWSRRELVAPRRKRSPSLGPITQGAKRAGKRSAGNPHAPFDRAGAGDGPTAILIGHEAGNGGHSQGEPTGYRARPRPYRATTGNQRLGKRPSMPSAWLRVMANAHATLTVTWASRCCRIVLDVADP